MGTKSKYMTLLASGSTSSAAPTRTDATLGVEMPYTADQVLILVRNTDVAAGTTKTATIRIWGYESNAARWYAIGVLNGGSPIGEGESDELNYTELLVGVRPFIRLYAQITTTLGGAGTEIEVRAIPTPAMGTSR
jgi:hypothetical protein